MLLASLVLILGSMVLLVGSVAVVCGVFCVETCGPLAARCAARVAAVVSMWAGMRERCRGDGNSPKRVTCPCVELNLVGAVEFGRVWLV